jgi:UDP-hydrolysing UDP-N-acetyl-D-glucosamine 2-epimerase
MSRRICVVTGSRAEYGLLRPLLDEIRKEPALQLQLIATGMHLSPEFGNTYRVIEEDGFDIDAKVEMLLSSDSPSAIAKSIGIGTLGFADTLARLAPDIVVLLGDRFEIFACAQAALCLRIPIAHIHGGESSEGAIDEAMRHSITKMAHLHFVSAEPYARRVIQLGEQPGRVFNVGAIGMDNIRSLPLLDKRALQKAIDFPLGGQNFLITYHPVTLKESDPREDMQTLLTALDGFPDAHLIFTLPNADAGGRVLIDMIHAYVARNPKRCAAFTSLGQLRYLSMLKLADVVIGNSSSGIIEAPVLRTPTVNIGDRQRGRLRAASVIDCSTDSDAITTAIQHALSPEFQATLAHMTHPYGDGGTAAKIVNELKAVDLHGLLLKRFYDLPEPGCT